MTLPVRSFAARGVLRLLVMGTAARPSAGQDRFACTEVLGFSCRQDS